MGTSKLKVYCAIFFAGIFMFGCNGRKYSNSTRVSKTLYTKDSVAILSKIKDEIEKRSGGFYAPKYSSETFICVDTIMYSPDSSKFMVFILNNAYIGNKETLEGKTYVGVRNKDTLNIVFYGYNLNGFLPTDAEEIKKHQHNYFFNDFSKIDEEGYEYNVNDIRFWKNNNFWDKIEKKIQSRAEFERMKSDDPKDIYEPIKHN